MEPESFEEGLRALHADLDRLGALAPETGELRSAWAEVARAEARLASVKLRLVAAAEAANVAVQDGSSDTGSWAVRAVGGNRARTWGAVWLAHELRDAFHHTAAALAEGRMSEEHAEV